MKVLLDTNVVFDFLLSTRGEFHPPAVRLMEQAATETIEAVLSTSQIADIFHSLRKAAGPKEARRLLSRLFELCALTPTMPSDCVIALGSDARRYEDAVQMQTAARIGCAAIATRNLRDYENSPVPAMSPAEVLELLAGTGSQAPAGDDPAGRSARGTPSS